MNIRHARPDDLNKIMEIYQYADIRPENWSKVTLEKNTCSFWKMMDRSKRYLFILLGMNQIITR